MDKFSGVEGIIILLLSMGAMYGMYLADSWVFTCLITSSALGAVIGYGVLLLVLLAISVYVFFFAFIGTLLGLVIGLGD